MKRLYKFAGIEVELFFMEESLYTEGSVLDAFQVETVDTPEKFEFYKVKKLDLPEGNLVAAFPGYRVYTQLDMQIRYIGTVSSSCESAYIRAEHRGKRHVIQVKESEHVANNGTDSILNALAAEHLVLEADGVILHASFIEYNGQAILFTAPSETGKSTQADLWKKHRDAEIINGDRAVIRLIDGKPFACGIPFAGSSKHCKNATLPLAAIVYLGQAKETTIRTFDFKTAFRKVWEGCTVNTWNPDDLNKAIDIVQNMTMQVPVYDLQCTPDESAVIALEKELEKI